jgi:hypothetical protein
MDEPLDDTPPPEELEMAVEESLGRPLAGNPADRMEALQKRIAYLQKQRKQLLSGTDLSDDALDGNAKDLAEAQRQLKEWKAQHEGRN